MKNDKKVDKKEFKHYYKKAMKLYKEVLYIEHKHEKKQTKKEVG